MTQVVEFSEVSSRVSADGELVTDIGYFVKSRGQQALRVLLPDGMRLWKVAVARQSVSARQDGNATLIPLPAGTDPNAPVEVRLGLAKPAQRGKNPILALPTVFAPVLKTVWKIDGETGRKLIPVGGTVDAPEPVLVPRGLAWVANHGLLPGFGIGLLVLLGVALNRLGGWIRLVGLVALLGAAIVAFMTASNAHRVVEATNTLELNLPVLASEEQVRLEVRNASLVWASLSVSGMVIAAAGLLLGVWSLFGQSTQKLACRITAALLVAGGLLLQRGGAPWFFGLLGALLFFLVFLPRAWRFCQDSRAWWRKWREKRRRKRKLAKEEAETAQARGANLSTELGGEA